jgi:hypothetical protein
MLTTQGEDASMGLTIEFYSADPKELAELFAAEASAEIDFDTYTDRLESYPMADFSLRLDVPDDLDRLCQFLHQQSPQIPTVFREVLVEQIWDDGVVSESLTELSRQFAEKLADLPESAVETVAGEWASTFPCEHLPQDTPAYQAVWQLQTVARDATDHKRSAASARLLRVLGMRFLNNIVIYSVALYRRDIWELLIYFPGC